MTLWNSFLRTLGMFYAYMLIPLFVWPAQAWRSLCHAVSRLWNISL